MTLYTLHAKHFLRVSYFSVSPSLRLCRVYYRILFSGRFAAVLRLLSQLVSLQECCEWQELLTRDNVWITRRRRASPCLKQRWSPQHSGLARTWHVIVIVIGVFPSPVLHRVRAWYHNDNVMSVQKVGHQALINPETRGRSTKFNAIKILKDVLKMVDCNII